MDAALLLVGKAKKVFCSITSMFYSCIVPLFYIKAAH